MKLELKDERVQHNIRIFNTSHLREMEKFLQQIGFRWRSHRNNTNHVVLGTAENAVVLYIGLFPSDTNLICYCDDSSRMYDQGEPLVYIPGCFYPLEVKKEV